jgi:Fe-S cluster biogenesis protein NfuA
MKENSTDENIIKGVIEDLRPYLNMDGGDIEFIKYDEENKTVFVKMFGACAMCMSQDETLEFGLLEAIKEKVPSVERIINTPL